MKRVLDVWIGICATAAAVWLILMAFGIAPVRAHGDAAWIAENPRYVDANGAHCCGVADCRREQAMFFRESPEGTWVTSIDAFGGAHETLMPIKLVRNGLYGSLDGDWWICVRDGTIKCVFKPTSGT